MAVLTATETPARTGTPGRAVGRRPSPPPRGGRPDDIPRIVPNRHINRAAVGCAVLTGLLLAACAALWRTELAFGALGLACLPAGAFTYLRYRAAGIAADRRRWRPSPRPTLSRKP